MNDLSVVVELYNLMGRSIGDEDPPIVVDVDSVRCESLPDRQQLTIAVEHLNPLVFAVTDEHSLIRIDLDGMGQIEFAGSVGRSRSKTIRSSPNARAICLAFSTTTLPPP